MLSKLLQPKHTLVAFASVLTRFPSAHTLRQSSMIRWHWHLAICLVTAVFLVACGRQPAAESSPIAQSTSSGSALFERLECIHCHPMNGNGPGPSLAGIYGTTITLESGESVQVDEQYIRTSILDSRAEIHAGYLPIMPPYQDRISEEELSILVDYIRTLEE